MKAPNIFAQIILLLMLIKDFSLSYVDLFKTNFSEVKLRQEKRSYFNNKI